MVESKCKNVDQAGNELLCAQNRTGPFFSPRTTVESNRLSYSPYVRLRLTIPAHDEKGHYFDIYILMKVGFKFSESFCRHLFLQRLPYLALKYDLSPWLFRLFISSPLPICQKRIARLWCGRA
jgi:hypothetical protein